MLPTVLPKTQTTRYSKFVIRPCIVNMQCAYVCLKYTHNKVDNLFWLQAFHSSMSTFQTIICTGTHKHTGTDIRTHAPTYARTHIHNITPTLTSVHTNPPPHTHARARATHTHTSKHDARMHIRTLIIHIIGKIRAVHYLLKLSYV